MANRYGTQKNKKEQISVGHFCRKHAMGAKKRKCSIYLGIFFVVVGLCLLLLPPTEMTPFLL